MAECVVDRFEMIQIAEKNRQTTPVSIDPRDLFIRPKIKIAAIVESGQRVEVGLLRQRLLGLLPLDDFVLKFLIGGSEFNGSLENPALQQLVELDYLFLGFFARGHIGDCRPTASGI